MDGAIVPARAATLGALGGVTLFGFPLEVPFLGVPGLRGGLLGYHCIYPFPIQTYLYQKPGSFLLTIPR